MIARETALGVRVDGGGKHFTVDRCRAAELDMPLGREFHAVQRPEGKFTVALVEQDALVFLGPAKIVVDAGSQARVRSYQYDGQLVGKFCRGVFEEITGIKLPHGASAARFDMEVASI